MSWDPEGEFVRQESAHRQNRDCDALVLDPNFIHTTTPLGQPELKADGGDRFKELQRRLGLDRPGVSLVAAVEAFDPDVETVAFLAEIMFEESETLATLLSSVDPIRLPTVEQRGFAVLFMDPDALTTTEFQALGNHLLLPAVQFVREHEKFDSLEHLAREPRYYFFDRNLARAYETLYSPWIAIWLYGFGTRCVPKSAERYLRWRAGFVPSAKPVPLARKVLAGPRFKARLDKLLAREHFLQSCLWYAILQCRAGKTVMEKGSKQERVGEAVATKRRGSTRMQVKTWIRELWDLRKHLAGARLNLHASTMQLLSRGDVPRQVVRAFTQLSDQRLYERAGTDPKVRARLDGITQMIVEASQQLESNEAKKTLALALFETPNVERVFGGQALEIKKRMKKSKARDAFLDEFWTNASLYFFEATSTWNPQRHGPFNAFLAKFLSNKAKALIRTLRQRLEWKVKYGDPKEDLGNSARWDAKRNPRADHDLDSPNLLCRPFPQLAVEIENEDRQHRVGTLIESKELTEKQRAVLREFYKALQETGDEEEARAIAVDRLGMTRVNFRVQLAYARKRLLALEDARP